MGVAGSPRNCRIFITTAEVDIKFKHNRRPSFTQSQVFPSVCCSFLQWEQQAINTSKWMWGLGHGLLKLYIYTCVCVHAHTHMPSPTLTLTFMCTSGGIAHGPLTSFVFCLFCSVCSCFIFQHSLESSFYCLGTFTKMSKCSENILILQLCHSEF